MTIYAQLENLSAVEQALRLIGLIGEDLSPVMKQAAAIMESASEDAFANESSPDGKAWPALKPSTVMGLVTKGRKVKGKKKRTGGKRRGEHPILQVRGLLAASVTTLYTGTRAEIGTNQVQAALQQFGGKAGRGHAALIPARAYIGLSPQNITDIEDAALQIIHKKVVSWLPKI